MNSLFEEERLNQSIEVNLETVKKKAVHGVAILTGRGFFLNIVAQVSQLLLLAFLTPMQLGTFWIVSAAVSFFIYFSDIGLAAALIQKKEKPTEIELKTTFTVQQGLVLSLLLILFFFTPYLVNIYSLSSEGKMLIYALGLSFFLSSLKSIPSVLVERRLEFGKFVIPEILENLVYNITVTYLAWRGFGVASFSYAVVARGVVGVVAIYFLQPWKPGIAFSVRAIKGLLKFGVPYQANSLISVFKDQGITLILGGILGSTAIGYLGSAMRLSQIPLRLFMDNVTKVSFPAFSRMQESKEELARSVTGSIMFITFLVFPTLFGFLVLVPDIMEIIPKYKKWEPAYTSLLIVSINTVFAAVATQLTNMLTAIGKIKITIKITIMYTVLTILLVPVFSLKYGLIGASWGHALVGISSVVTIYVGRKIVPFSILRSFWGPAISTFGMFLVILFLRYYLSATLLNIFLIVFFGGISYLVFSYLILGPSLVGDAKKIIKTFLGK